ncbi:MAG TPA: FtsX-like permease family protein [Pirellulales bacterium]|nr:FtsX-like permease family protein [Pirellulales bacterium]
MRLARLSVRQMLARPGRTVLTLLSVVIGVAAVASVSLAIGTTRRAYQDMFVALTGRADIEITAVGTGGIDQGLVQTLEQMPGVKAAVPMMQKATVLYHNHRRIQILALGIDPVRDRQVRDYEVAAGQFLDGGDGAMLDANFARELEIKVGDTVKINIGGVRSLKVVGLLAPTGVASFSQGASLFLPLSTAQQFFRRRGRVDNIQVVKRPGVGTEALLIEINRHLPPGVMAGQPAVRTEFADESLAKTERGLDLAAALSELLAVFIILNTFLMSVTERRPQLAMLRVVGATRGQLVRLLVGEGFILGLVGTILGLAAGVGGAYLITRLLERALQARLPALHITAGPLVLSAVLGVGLSMLSVLIPAIRAGRVSPLEGLGARGGDNLGRLPYRLAMLSLAILFFAGNVLVAALTNRAPGSFAVPSGAVVLVGLVLLLPAILQPFSKLASWPLYQFAPAESRLARRRMMQHPIRTTLTIGVLFLAISAGIGLGTTVVNSVDDLQRWIQKTIVYDFYVRATMPDMATGEAADIPPDAGQEIEKIPGIARVGTVRLAPAKAAGYPVIIISKDFSTNAKLPLDLAIGNPDQVLRELFEGQVVIGTPLAQRARLTVNDSIALETKAGLKRFRIAGVSNEVTVGGMVIFVNKATAEKQLGISGVSTYVIIAKPSQGPAVEAALRKICTDHGLLFQSAESFRSLVNSVKNGITGGLWVLLVLAFTIAAFGIVNTLTMNVIEQTREIAILRVVAMTRWQIRKTILCEAATMGLMGLLPGAIIGAGIGYLMDLDTSPIWGQLVAVRVHPGLNAMCFVLAYLMSLAAAWAPAERAARLELMTALHYE